MTMQVMRHEAGKDESPHGKARRLRRAAATLPKIQAA
jgi:hypothetical protein